jgi:TetR/AcrR family tetracycline transcriptional repressor
VGEGNRNKEQELAGRPRKDDARLDTARIVDTAWALVDRDGLDGLTSRALATELQVKGPALFWHVRSMQLLRSLMIERLLLGTIAPPRPGQPWHDWLQEVGEAQRRQMLSHRDCGRIAASAEPTEKMRDTIIPAMMQPLIEAGFADLDAFAAAGTIASFVLGWVVYEQNAETGRYVASVTEPERAFLFGLSAIVAGLRAKIA